MTEVLIEGVWCPARSRAEQVVHNPATLDPVGAAPFCDAQDVVVAMAAARRALGPWRALSQEERAARLVDVGRRLSADAAAIAEVQARESGQAFRECLDVVREAARCFKQLSNTDPSAVRETRDQQGAPAGAKPLVLDQDYPLLHWACCAAPLLAEGSTLVCVAPRRAPLAVLRAGRCADALPAGVLNLLVATPEVVTAALGEAVPSEGTRPAAGDLVRSTRDTIFVADTVGLDMTLAGTVSLRLFHSGQRAGQSARIYVEQGISNGLADKLHEYLAFLECGDPRKAATDLGPLCSSAALQRVEGQVAGALKHGALLKLGGRRYQPWGLVGYFFQPTLMIEGPGEERVPEEEIRGPVVIISPVRCMAEALQRERLGRITFFGNDLNAQLSSLTAAGMDFALTNFSSPLERIWQDFRTVPKGPVHIETVTSYQSSWFPYGSGAALS